MTSSGDLHHSVSVIHSRLVPHVQETSLSLLSHRLRVLCECGIRPCEWGAGDGKPNFNLRARGGIVTRKGDVIPKPTSCRLLVAVEDEDEGPSASARYDNAVQCQRVNLRAKFEAYRMRF